MPETKVAPPLKKPYEPPKRGSGGTRFPVGKRGMKPAPISRPVGGKR